VSISSIQNALFASRAENSEMSVGLRSAEDRVKALEAELNLSRNEIQTWKGQVLMLQAKGNDGDIAERLEAEQAKLEASGMKAVLEEYKQDTSLKIDQQHRQYADVLAENQTLGKRCRELDSLVASRDVRIRSLEDSLATARADSEEALIVVRAEMRLLEDENIKLRARVAELSAIELSPRSRKIVVEMSDKPTNAMDELLAMYKAETAGKLESLYKQYIQVKADNEELQSRCARQALALQGLEDELTKVRDREAMLRMELDRAREVLAVVEGQKMQLEVELRELRGLFAQFKNETTLKIESQGATIQELMSIDENLRERIRQLEADLGTKDATIDSLRRALLAAKADTSELDDLRAKLHRCESELGLVKAEKDGIMGSFLLFKDETTLKVEALNIQNAELLGQIEMLKEKIRQLESIVGERDATIASLRTALLGARGEREEIATLKGIIAQQKTVEQALLADLERLKNQPDMVVRVKDDGAFADMTCLIQKLSDDTAAGLYAEKADELRKAYLEVQQKYAELSDRVLQQDGIARAERRVLEEELRDCRNNNSRLQAELDRLRVIASDFEIEKGALQQEKEGMGGVLAMRSIETETKLEDLNFKYTELLGTSEALREKCRQLESSLSMREMTIMSLQKVIQQQRELEGANGLDNSEEIKLLEEEMARISSAGQQSLQRLQVDVMRLQMQGKKVQQKEIFTKIDREFELADSNKDGHLSRDEWSAAFGLKSPSRRQFEKMAVQEGDEMFVTKDAFKNALLKTRPGAKE